MIQFIVICLVIMPWIFFPNPNLFDQFRLPQATFMSFMFLTIIASSFSKGNQFVYKNKYLSWLLGWVFLNLIVQFIIPFNLMYKQTGRSLNVACLEPMIHIILGAWAMQILLSTLDRFDFVRIAKALCLSSVLIASFGIMQFLGWNPWGVIKSGYVCGNIVSACLDNPNLVGMYCCLVLPLYFMFSEVKYGIGLLISVAGIAVSDCHFAIVMAILLCIAHFIIKYRKNKALILSSGILFSAIGILIFVTDFTKLKVSCMSGRLMIWKFGWERFMENPIFGHGLGVFKTYSFYDRGTAWFCVHNDWLERLIEIGVVGVVLMVLVIYNSYKRFTYEGEVNFSYLLMFTAFLVFMVGSFPLEVPTIAMLGLVSFMAMEKM